MMKTQHTKKSGVGHSSDLGHGKNLAGFKTRRGPQIRKSRRVDGGVLCLPPGSSGLLCLGSAPGVLCLSSASAFSR